MKRMRTVLRWIFWVIVAQFVLINLSAIMYAYRHGHFYTNPSDNTANNFFTNTWKLFTGPRYVKLSVTHTPEFPFETIKLTTESGMTICAWYSPANLSHGSVILVHGVTVNKSFVIDEATAFREMGYNVMLVDLRAHGESDGNSFSSGFKETEEIKLAFDYVKSRHTGKIFLFGTSMGSVVIARAVANKIVAPDGIIMEMPFESLQTYFKARARTNGFRAQPFGILVTFWTGIMKQYNGFRHRTTSYASNIHIPVLMQWGSQDRYVLKKETQNIFKKIPVDKKKLVVYQEAGHESLLNHDPMRWHAEVRGFLNGL